jgi:hypothetical protein
MSQPLPQKLKEIKLRPNKMPRSLLTIKRKARHGQLMLMSEPQLFKRKARHGQLMLMSALQLFKRKARHGQLMLMSAPPIYQREKILRHWMLQ